MRSTRQASNPNAIIRNVALTGVDLGIACKSILLLSIVFHLSSCFYIPPLSRQFTDDKRTQIRVGETTRSEVIDLLGKPDVVEYGPYAIYDVQRSAGSLLFYGGGWMRLDGERFRVLLQFDLEDVVARYDIEEADISATGEWPKPADPDRWRIDPESRLFSGEMKLLFGSKTQTAFSSIAFSADGQMLAAAGQDAYHNISSKRIWLHDFARDQQRVIETGDYYDVEFSADLSRALLMARNGRLLDLSSGIEIAEFPKKLAICGAFDASGAHLITVSRNGRISVRDASSAIELESFDALRDIYEVAISADGQLLATVSSKRQSVRFWNLATGEQMGPTLEGRSRRTDVEFSPVGNVFAIVRPTHVEVWRWAFDPTDAANALTVELSEIFLLPIVNPYVGGLRLSLAFSPDGRYLAAGNRAFIVVDLRTNKRVHRVVADKGGNLNESRGVIHGLAFSPNGDHIAAATVHSLFLLPATFRARGN